MDLGLAGNAYVVLGGTRGMGRETVRLLAEEGANVAVISRNPGSAQPDFERLAAEHGVEILGLLADASHSGEVEAAIGSAIRHFGRLHGCAVTNHWMGQSRAFEAVEDAEWHDYFQHSLMGAVRTARAVLPHMAENGGGNLVLTSAFSSRAPKPYIPAYAAFKAALNNLVKSLMKAYGPSGVRVNAVAPGAIRTGRYDERLTQLHREASDITTQEAEAIMLEQLDMKVALERIGDPSEVAELIVFLLSARGGYINGLIANIDGGTDF